MEIETTEKDSNNEKIIGLYNISLTVLDGVRFGFGFGVPCDIILFFVFI